MPQKKKISIKNDKPPVNSESDNSDSDLSDSSVENEKVNKNHLTGGDSDPDADDVETVDLDEEEDEDDDGESEKESEDSDEEEKKENDSASDLADDDDCIHRPGKKKKRKVVESDDDIEENFFPEEEIIEQVYVLEENRVTAKKMTKYERVRIICDRADQISKGSVCFAKGVNIQKKLPEVQAELELIQKVCPLIVKRTLPSGEIELINANELTIFN